MLKYDFDIYALIIASSIISPLSFIYSMTSRFLPALTLFLATLILSACGSSSNDDDTTPQAAPGTPSTPTLRVISHNHINVIWGDVAGATSYQIYRSETAATNTLTKQGDHAVDNFNTFADNNLDIGTTYYYAIKACNSVCSALSGVVSTQTHSIITPAIPSTITFNNVTSNQITVNWSSVANSQYKLYRITGTPSSTESFIADSVLISTTSALSYNDTGLSPSTVYSYGIRACNVASAEYCSGLHINAQATILAAPIFSLSAISSSQINVTWSTNNAVTYIDILRSNPVTNPSDEIFYSTIASPLTSLGNVYMDMGLQPDTTYYYRTVACNELCSSRSIALNTKTHPDTLVVNAISASAIEIHWVSASDATSYELYRSTHNNTSNFAAHSTLILTTSALSYIDTPLAASTTYHYSIKSCAGSNASRSCSDFLAVRSAFTFTARYIISNNEDTVTDSSTSLMWQRNSGGLAVQYATAVAAAASSTLGGYNDWRLPTVAELQSLVLTGQTPVSPTIDRDAFPGTHGSAYWASDTVANAGQTVDFSHGGFITITISGGDFALFRLVRDIN